MRLRPPRRPGTKLWPVDWFSVGPPYRTDSRALSRRFPCNSWPRLERKRGSFKKSVGISYESFGSSADVSPRKINFSRSNELRPSSGRRFGNPALRGWNCDCVVRGDQVSRAMEGSAILGGLLDTSRFLPENPHPDSASLPRPRDFRPDRDGSEFRVFAVQRGQWPRPPEGGIPNGGP